MYQIDFHKPLSIHFIGIGGISMSGLAEILLEEGFTISGSDSKKSPLTSLLENKGAKVYYGQRASNSCHPSGHPGMCMCEGKRSPDADKSSASRTDHAQLRHFYCSCRHAWKDHNYFHVVTHSSEG